METFPPYLKPEPMPYEQPLAYHGMPIDGIYNGRFGRHLSDKKRWISFKASALLNILDGSTVSTKLYNITLTLYKSENK